jgi:hypothetical protein
MTITGGIKFFEKSKFLFVNGATAYSMTGTNAQHVLNHNRNNKWETAGSNDTIKETLVVSLDQEYEIDRLILNGHNFKDVTIYMLTGSRLLLEDGNIILLEDGNNIILEDDLFSAGQWYRYIVQETATTTSQDLIELEQGGYLKHEKFTDFSFIPTDPGLQRTLTGSNLSSSTTYFAFDSTRVKNLIIETTTTQIANQEKFLKVLLGTNEIGTLDLYPAVAPVFNRNIRRYTALSGKSIIQKNFESINIQMDFAGYPGQADMTIIEALQDSDEDFVIWLCGGREGTDYFRYLLKGWKIDDLYLGNIINSLPLSYTNNIYINPYNTRLTFAEVTG